MQKIKYPVLDIWAAGMDIIELLRVKPITRSEVRTKLFLLFSQPQLRIKETFYSPRQHIQGFANQAYLGQQEPNLGGSGSTSVSVQRFRTQISVVMVKFTSEDLLNPARPHVGLHFLSLTQSNVNSPFLSLHFGYHGGHSTFI